MMVLIAILLLKDGTSHKIKKMFIKDHWVELPQVLIAIHMMVNIAKLCIKVL